VDWGPVAAAAFPALGVVLAALIRQGPEFSDTARRRLRQDVEIAEKLPKESAAYGEMLSIIEEDVAALRNAEARGRRDIPWVISAAVGAGFFGWMTLLLVQQDSWWLRVAAVVPVFLVIVFMYGAFESWGRAPRDRDGLRVESPSEDSPPKLG
jgi:hypothetical protein